MKILKKNDDSCCQYGTQREYIEKKKRKQINARTAVTWVVGTAAGCSIARHEGRGRLLFWIPRNFSAPPSVSFPTKQQQLLPCPALQRLLTQIKPKPIRRLPIPSSRRPAPPPRPPSPAIGASASGPAAALRHLPPRWGATRSPPRGCCPTCSAPTSCRSTSPSSPTTVRARSSLPSGVPSESQPIG